jgi:hypothetical protein
MLIYIVMRVPSSYKILTSLRLEFQVCLRRYAPASKHATYSNWKLKYLKGWILDGKQITMRQKS